MSELRKKTVKAIGWNTLATLINQTFGVVTSVVLTRLLNPDDFGIIMMVIVFTGFGDIIKDMGFSGALVQRKEIHEGHKSSVFWINAATGIILTSLFFFLAPWIAEFYNDARLILVTRVLAISYILSSLNTVQFSLVKRAINFKKIAGIRVVRNIIAGILAMILAYMDWGYWALIWQTLVGATIALFLYWFLSSWKPKLIFKKDSVKELMSFGVNISLVRMLNYFGNKLDVFLIGKLMGSQTLGYYNRSRKFQGLPFQAIKAQISSVLFPTLSQLQDNKAKQADVYLKLTAFMSLAIFPIMMGLFAVAEEFVIVVLTKKWEAIIPLVRVFSLAYLFAAIGFPNMTFTANNRTRELLNVSIFLRMLRIALVVIGVLKGSVFTVTVAVAISIVIEQLTMNYYAAKIMEIPLMRIIKTVVPILIASYLMAGVVIGADYLFMDGIKNMPRMLLKVGIGVVFYMLFLVIFKPNPLPFIFEHYWPPRMKSIRNFIKS